MPAKRRAKYEYGELPLCKKYNASASPIACSNKSNGKSYTRYEVTCGWDEANRRIRRKCATLEEARLVVQKVLGAVEGERAGDIKTVVDVATSHEIKAAQEKLRRYGVSISEAVSWYCKHHDQIKEWVTVDYAWEEWKRFRKPHDETTGKNGGREAVSTSYFESMCDTYIGPFAKVFGERRLVDLVKEDFEEWLFEIKTGVKNSQKKVHLQRLVVFLSWCTDKGFYSNQLKPLDNIAIGNDPIDEADDLVKVLHPEVVRSMLDFALLAKRKSDYMVGIWLVVRLFCGPRSSEVLRLKWGMIGEDGTVRMPAQRTKKGVKRYFSMTANAKAWLEAFFGKFTQEQKDNEQGFIITNRGGSQLNPKAAMRRFKRFQERWRAWAKENKRKHQAEIAQNACRDTFGSYGLIVLGQDKAFRAMGERDVSTFYNRYYNAVTEKAAKAFFKVMPYELPVPDSSAKKAKKGKYFVDSSKRKKSVKDDLEIEVVEEPIEMTITTTREQLLKDFPHLPADFKGSYVPEGTRTTYKLWE